ncbi:MAG: hypothetical protein WCR72_08945 [Bacteroidota bacterium]
MAFPALVSSTFSFYMGQPAFNAEYFSFNTGQLAFKTWQPGIQNPATGIQSRVIFINRSLTGIQRAVLAILCGTNRYKVLVPAVIIDIKFVEAASAAIQVVSRGLEVVLSCI